MAAAGAHRYWALFIEDGYSQNWTELYEASLSIGGVNQTTPSTPVSSSVNPWDGYPASNLVDGNTNTVCSINSGTNTNIRITFDLGSPKAIEKLSYYANGNNNPRYVRIECSDDGATFTTVVPSTLFPQTAGWHSASISQAPPDPNAPQKTILTLSVASATGWTNPSYLTASGSNYAYSSLDNTSTHNATFNSNAASALPADAVILGVEISYKAYVNTTGPATRIFTSFPSSPGSYPTTSAVLYTKGGPTDKLGVNSAADIASPWLRVGNTAGGSATLYLNSFSIAVYWRIPAAGNPLFFGEMF